MGLREGGSERWETKVERPAQARPHRKRAKDETLEGGALSPKLIATADKKKKGIDSKTLFRLKKNKKQTKLEAIGLHT